MRSLLKKIFSRQKDHLYSLKKEPDFENGYEFQKPEATITDLLKKKLTELQIVQGQFVTEAPLKGKKMFEYTDMQDLIKQINHDLETNYFESSEELKMSR